MKYEQKAVALGSIAVNEHRDKNGATKKRKAFCNIFTAITR
jgi:hypothetical protein